MEGLKFGPSGRGPPSSTRAVSRGSKWPQSPHPLSFNTKTSTTQGRHTEKVAFSTQHLLPLRFVSATLKLAGGSLLVEAPIQFAQFSVAVSAACIPERAAFPEWQMAELPLQCESRCNRFCPW